MPRPDLSPRRKVLAGALGGALVDAILGIFDWAGASPPPDRLEHALIILGGFSVAWLVRSEDDTAGLP